MLQIIPKIKPKNRHIYLNVFIGLLILGILHSLEDTRFGIRNLDGLFDAYIRYESSVASEKAFSLEQSAIISKDIVFIEIPLSKYKEWNYPGTTPRDVLAQIIHLSDSAGAKIIIPDFTFADKDCSSTTADDSLGKVLKRIALRNSSKVIIPALLGWENRLRANIYDSLIDSSENIFRALPLVMASSHDGVVRYAENFSYFKVRKGNIVLKKKIWSVSKLTSMLYHDASLSKNSLNVEIDPGVENKAKDMEEAENSKPEEYLYEKRIRFLIVPGRLQDSDTRSGNIPMEQFFTIDNVNPDCLKGKIVLLGSFNPESSDNHLTPIGSLPGMYILGNALNTEIMQIFPKKIPSYGLLGIEILVIIFAAYLFYWYNEFAAQLIASIIIIIVFGFANYRIFLKYGIFIDFIFPVIGMGMHRIFSSLEKVLVHGSIKDHKQN